MADTEKRSDLRTRLIDAAEAEIAEKGLLGLKARDVTARAGCALGAIYNAVSDLDAGAAGGSAGPVFGRGRARGGDAGAGRCLRRLCAAEPATVVGLV